MATTHEIEVRINGVLLDEYRRVKADAAKAHALLRDYLYGEPGTQLVELDDVLEGMAAPLLDEGNIFSLRNTLSGNPLDGLL